MSPVHLPSLDLVTDLNYSDLIYIWRDEDRPDVSKITNIAAIDTYIANDRVIYADKYGVVADGVTDNYWPLTEAIAAAAGKVLVLPYALSGNEIYLSFPVDPSVCAGIIGQGPDQTILKPETIAFQFNPTALYRFKMGQLGIIGGTIGIYFTGSDGARFTHLFDIRMASQTSAGLKVDCEFNNAVLDRVQCDGQNYGFWFTGTKVHFVLDIRDCRAVNTKLAGFYFDNSSGSGGSAAITMLNCALESNERHAVRMNRTKGMTFINCYLEENSQEAQGYADIQIDAALAFNCENIILIGVNGSYDLGQPQPQICIEAEAGAVDEITLIDSRLGGYELQTGGANVNIIGGLPPVVVGATDRVDIANGALLLTDPTGDQWKLKVDDAGALSTEAV